MSRGVSIRGAGPPDVFPRPHNASEALDRVGLTLIPLLEPVCFDCIADRLFLSGSLADGFGNQASDVDFYVIGPTGRTRSERYWQGGYWIDVTGLSLDDLSSCAELCDRAAAYPNRWGEHVLRYGQLDIMHRLSIALEIGAGNQTGPRIIDAARLSRAAAFSHLFTVRNLWIDLAGAVASKAWRQAASFLAIAAERLLDAEAALLGEANPNSKWRDLKLERAGLGEHPACRYLHASPAESDRSIAEEGLRYFSNALFSAMCRLAGAPQPDLPSLELGQRHELVAEGTVFRVDVGGNACVVGDIGGVARHAQGLR